MTLQSKARPSYRRDGYQPSKSLWRRSDRRTAFRGRYASQWDAQAQPVAFVRKPIARTQAALWMMMVVYVLGAPAFLPIARFLRPGSSLRGALLLTLPLAGAAVVSGLRSRPHPVKRTVAVCTFALVVLEIAATTSSLGWGYVSHALPGIAAVVLALAGRREVAPGYGQAELRRDLRGLCLPALVIYLAGWIVQLTGAVESLYPSSFPLSVHGYRLQGLSVHPAGFGFLVAILCLLSCAAASSPFVWVVRVIGLLTLLGTNARTSLIAFGAGLVVMWVFGAGVSFARRYAAALALGALGFVVTQIVVVARTDTSGVLTGRPEVWKALTPFLHTVPIFGYGPDFVSRENPKIFGPYGSIFDAQNQWLSDALCFGYMVALATVVLVAVLATAGPASYRRLIGLPMFAMLLVESFSEVPFNIWDSTAIVMPLFLYLLVTPAIRRQDPVMTEPFRMRGPIAPGRSRRR